LTEGLATAMFSLEMRSKMAAVMKFVESMSQGMFEVRKRTPKVRVSELARKTQSAGRRPNQKVSSFNTMSERDRIELADMLEAELARL